MQNQNPLQCNNNKLSKNRLMTLPTSPNQQQPWRFFSETLRNSGNMFGISEKLREATIGDTKTPEQASKCQMSTSAGNFLRLFDIFSDLSQSPRSGKTCRSRSANHRALKMQPCSLWQASSFKQERDTRRKWPRRMSSANIQ